ncbi:hypothetical protein DFJ73DRAFT_865227 [Zopfochytrium polystomum]|nr:hypothetical protein DFJ73DRAFT_865227 [Zopfochytrium polystomum]
MATPASAADTASPSMTHTAATAAPSRKPRSAKPSRRRFIDPKKSVTFQVVHRSQRDPALADPNASRLVLREVPHSGNLQRKKIVLPTAQDTVPDLDVIDRGEYLSSDFGGEYYDDDDEEGGSEFDDACSYKSDRSRGTIVSKVAASVAAKEDPSMYGIYFDDQESYDYMKHLKTIGDDPSAVFVSARGAKEGRTGIHFREETASVAMSKSGRRKVQFDFPSESMPSQFETRVGLLNQEPTVDILDVEPEMREVLYALDDEEYVEDDVDDFFAALDADEVPEGLNLIPEDTFVPRRPADIDDDEYDEDAVPDVDEESDEEEPEWFREYRKFKKSGKQRDDDAEEEEDERDGRKTAISALSMTSSAMVRTKQLTLLDDKFDELLRKEYDNDDDDSYEENLDPSNPNARKTIDLNSYGRRGFGYEDDGDRESVAASKAQPSVGRKHLNAALEAFLTETEVVGRSRRTKIIPRRISGHTGIDALRGALTAPLEPGDGDAAIVKQQIAQRGEEMTAELEAEVGGAALDEELEREVAAEEEARGRGKERWDVETIMSTYSNVYNRPKLIAAVERTAPKIRFVKGRPVVVEAPAEKGDVVSAKPGQRDIGAEDEDGEEDEFDEEEGAERVNLGAARSKNETKEEKKARKQAVKEQRKSRRNEKKELKEAFKKESKTQKKLIMAHPPSQEKVVAL